MLQARFVVFSDWIENITSLPFSEYGNGNGIQPRVVWNSGDALHRLQSQRPSYQSFRRFRSASNNYVTGKHLGILTPVYRT